MRWRRRLLRRQRKNGTTPRDTQRNAEEKALREEREAHARRATERARQLAGRPGARFAPQDMMSTMRGGR